MSTITTNAGVSFKLTSATVKEVDTSDKAVLLDYNGSEVTIKTRGATQEEVFATFKDCIAGDTITIDLGVSGGKDINTGALVLFVHDATKVHVTLIERIDCSATLDETSSTFGASPLTSALEESTTNILNITGGELASDAGYYYYIYVPVQSISNLELTAEPAELASTAVIKQEGGSDVGVDVDVKYENSNFVLKTRANSLSIAVITINVKWTSKATNTDTITINIGEGVTYGVKQNIVTTTYTIDFSSLSTGRDGSALAADKFTSFEGHDENVNSITTNDKVYSGKTENGVKYGLKFGSSKVAGELTITLNEGITVTKVQVYGAKYNDSNYEITANDISTELTDDLTVAHEIELATATDTVILKSNKRCYVQKVVLIQETLQDPVSK